VDVDRPEIARLADTFAPAKSSVTKKGKADKCSTSEAKVVRLRAQWRC
jgi:hypothetical protein